MSYRLEYAPSGRAGCKGADPCKGTKIDKGELRIGSMVTIKEQQSFQWRHWGCTTQRVLQNIKKKIGDDASEIDGYEDLREEDQQRIRKAFEEGHVAEEDVPSTQVPEGKKEPKKRKKKGDDDEEGEGEADGDAEPSEKKAKAPAKKRAPKKAKKEEDDDDENADGDAEEKPAPKKRARKPKKAASDDESGDADEKPAEKPKPKRAAAKKKAKKEESEEEAQDEDDE